MQLAAAAVDQYPDGAWLVDLTALRRPDLVAQAVAAALDVRELPNEPIDATLQAYLRERRLLLVIDNSEHLLGAVAALVKNVLQQCPAVTIVATSRQPLHVAGEQVYRLGPLVESTRLFVERAQRAAPAISFGGEENAEVRALCEKLEGLPLAIELACARLSSMSLKQLSRRLQSVLTLSSKDVTERSRHRALRETIAWSYELLDGDERAALGALAVFHGGCSVAAVAAVAPGVPDIDDVLDSLVDKSLLALDDAEGDERYRLLDAVREFAYERLRAARRPQRSSGRTRPIMPDSSSRCGPTRRRAISRGTNCSMPTRPTYARRSSGSSQTTLRTRSVSFHRSRHIGGCAARSSKRGDGLRARSTPRRATAAVPYCCRLPRALRRCKTIWSRRCGSPERHSTSPAPPATRRQRRRRCFESRRRAIGKGASMTRRSSIGRRFRSSARQAPRAKRCSASATSE